MSNSELPEAYKIGWVPFIHTKIFLDSRPLIPRTETEYWVHEVIQKIKASGLKNPHVLDLCAGSGAIGVAVLSDIPEAEVDFVEVDPLHHETIRRNVRENGLNIGQTRIMGGNLFEEVSGTYNFILSNPPYVDMSLARVANSVLEYEPHLALDGGKDGLEIISKILDEASSHLNPGGILYIEHEPEQVEVLSQHPLYTSTEKDQFGVRRFSIFKN